MKYNFKFILFVCMLILLNNISRAQVPVPIAKGAAAISESAAKSAAPALVGKTASGGIVPQGTASLENAARQIEQISQPPADIRGGKTNKALSDRPISETQKKLSAFDKEKQERIIRSIENAKNGLIDENFWAAETFLTETDKKIIDEAVTKAALNSSSAQFYPFAENYASYGRFDGAQNYKNPQFFKELAENERLRDDVYFYLEDADQASVKEFIRYWESIRWNPKYFLYSPNAKPIEKRLLLAFTNMDEAEISNGLAYVELRDQQKNLAFIYKTTRS